MSTLMTFILVISLLVMLVCLVLALYQFITKKKSPKRSLIAAGISFMVMIAAALALPADETAEPEADTDAETSETKAEEKAEKEEEIPELSISLKDDFSDGVLLKQTSVTLEGEAKEANECTVNGRKVELDKDGNFSTVINLQEGANKITVKAAYTVDGKVKATKEKTIEIMRENPDITLTVPAAQTIQEKTYTLKGTTEPGATVTLYKESTKLKTTNANSKGEYIFTVDTATVGQYHLVVEAAKADFNTVTKKVDITREMSEEEELASKRANAQSIGYAHLEKNPDRYSGEYVKYRGEILQILEEGVYTVIRLAVTPTSYGYDYGDVIWVEYIGLTDFVEGDVVTVYGTISGDYSYQSTAGWTITIPAMTADTIE